MSYNQQQNVQFTPWNNQQQPNMFQGQMQNQDQPFGQSDFPAMQAQSTPQQQQNLAAPADNPFGNSVDFKPTSSEFVPQGVVAGQEEFQAFGEAFGAGSKKAKKQGPTAAQLKKEKEEAQLALPTKGKTAEFFMHNGQLGQEQMVFVFQYYPQYSMNPIEIVNWLHGEANRIEQEEKQKQMLEQQAYGQPPRSKNSRNNQQYEEYEDEDLTNEESTFGVSAAKGNKKGKKKDAGKVDTGAKRDKEERNAERLAKQEEAKKVKIVKDVVVKIDEDTITEVDETRQPCSLVFIGHVDAGKSTISGQMMYLTGSVDERMIEKYKKDAKDKGRDSWWLAYCMDIGEEEQAKGKTVEVGRATFNTKQKQFTVFDAPGHKNYVPNMIVGAALADYAGLVISARRGEFEAGFEKDGQTREHVQLAKSLGVQKLVVVVNKMDEPSVLWSEARWTEICSKLEPFLEKSGYSSKDVQYVPISGLTGDNIEKKVDPKVCDWYKGETLMHILDNLPVENRDPNGPLRLPILERVKEQGVVAHGKIESGKITVGDKICVSPSGYPAQIGQILDHKNESVRFARPGENVQITLIHINEEGMINKGDVISCREKVTPVTCIFEAEMDVLELLQTKPILSKGYSCVMHCHTFADDITIDTILEVRDQNAQGKWETNDKAKFIKSMQQCRVRISTRQPLAMEKYEVLPQMGRFTLRDEGRTIAVGKILKYKPHKVMSTIQVSGEPKKQTTDKNEALVFDMESGKADKAPKKLDAIAEE